MKLLRFIPLILFLLGYGVLAVAGTRSALVFQWPSYVLFGLVALAVPVLLRRRNQIAPSVWCLGSMLLLTGYVVVRAALSPIPYFGRMDIAMVLAAAITYLLFSLCLIRSRYRLALVALLVTLSAANVVVGLYQLIRDPDFKVIPSIERPHLEGDGGFYESHNHLGGFLIITVAFALGLLVFGRMGQKARVLVLFIVAVSLFGVAITASRGTLLSLGFVLLAVLALGLFLARSLYRYEFKKILVIASALAAIGLVPTLIVGSKTLAARSGMGGADGQVTNLAVGGDVRITNWSLALDQFKDYPVFGQGARMYDVYSVKHWPGSMNWVRADPEFAHNDYLQMLGEYGLVGFALVALFILTHVVSGLRYLIWYRNEGFEKIGRSTNNDLALCFGALVLMAGYAVHSFLDFNLHLPVNFLPVVFAFSILATPSARPWQSATGTAPLALFGRLILPVCGVALGVLGVMFGPGEWHTERARRLGFSDYPVMLSHLDKARESDGGNFYTHHMRGTALMRFGSDFDIDQVRVGFMARAAESFEEGLRANPYDLFSLVGLARCLSEMGEHERAEELFQTAIELGPWRREPHLRYGHFHLERGLSLLEEDFPAGIKRIEMAKDEFEASQNANDKRPVKGDPAYGVLFSAKRSLRIVYEEYARRLVQSATLARESEGRDAELAYLRSAEDYLMRAQAEGAKTMSVKRTLELVRKRLSPEY